MKKLSSEKVVIEAPTSFKGAAKRIFKLIDTADRIENKWVRGITKVFLWFLALNITVFSWIFVAMWYFVIFYLFGLLVIPFRLFTRSNRKAKRQKLQHRELLDAISKMKK